MRRLLFACVIGLCACASRTAETLWVRPTVATDPLSEPAPPQSPPTNGVAEYNTEYWLGSEAEEAQQFAAFRAQIQLLQQAASEKHQQGTQRGFHAKSHACLDGKLTLDPARPPHTRFGVFADESPERSVYVRFSNGVGWSQSDKDLDARGMAIKVLDVPGTTYLADESGTQDFLLTNAPTPVGKDAVEFMEFARANADGTLAQLFFLAGHVSTAGGALTATSPIDSVVKAQYWSGGAYHLGAHQAIKYTAKPCDPYLPRPPRPDHADYLQLDVEDAARGGICMALYVQFQADPALTPIENASVEWTEELSPFVKVATITMPAQTTWDRQKCDQLSFSPWHAIAAHKPMGHINRARRHVYDASRSFRNGGGLPAAATK
jgi:Catalase